MGKIRRYRQKLHLSAKGKQAKDLEAEKVSALPLPDNIVFPAAEGLFSNKDLDGLDFLSQRLPVPQKQEDDRMTYISKKSINDEGRLKKKDKMKLRHERWLQKIDTIKQAKKSTKAAKNRSQAPIVGDLHPLSLALPELAKVLRLGETGNAKQSQQSKNSQQKTKPNQSTMKTKDRKKLLLEEQAKFQQVSSHSAFKSNPLSTINEHLRNKMQKEQQEAMEDSNT